MSAPRPFLLLATSLLAAGDDGYLADIGPAPAVSLIDQDGRPYRLADRRGKAVLVGFVYTTCSGTCPLTTARMAEIQDLLRRQGLWGDRVEFASISLDPERDNPEALRRYAAAYRADLDAWRFLTGEPSEVRAVWKAWDMWAEADASGTINHPSRVFLIDPSGRQREIYSLEFLDPEGVARDLRSVLGTASDGG